MNAGERVHIAESSGPLGLLELESSRHFHPELVAVAGDECEVVAAGEPMPEGWLLVRHLETGLLCPVHPSMLEAAGA